MDIDANLYDSLPYIYIHTYIYILVTKCVNEQSSDSRYSEEGDGISSLNFLFYDSITVAQFPVDTRIRPLAYSSEGET